MTAYITQGRDESKLSHGNNSGQHESRRLHGVIQQLAEINLKTFGLPLASKDHVLRTFAIYPST